jgi:hypothetical protein
MKQPIILAYETLNTPVQLNTGQRYQGVGQPTQHAQSQTHGTQPPLEPLMDNNGGLRTQSHEQHGNAQSIDGNVEQATADVSAEQIQNVQLHSVFFKDTSGAVNEIVVDTPFNQQLQGSNLRKVDLSLRHANGVEMLQVELDTGNQQIVGSVINAQQQPLNVGERRITGYTLQIQ